ncbi:MAG: LLM class F420-dependent oxidoreductase [Candidatus Promineifilaceae bacterium]|jgi:F420-dependent oxidoreductase-like protein
MLEVAIMIEGQDGLNWPRWQRLARAVEELGFVGLYRSDHYTNANPPDKDSLELWVSLAWLADNTQRIEFGPLVSPVSFRHPTMTARMASAVDDLSGGRLILGMGAGWQEREHTHYGWDLLPVPQRFARFEEGLEVVTRLLSSEEPVDFDGRYYRLQEAILLPRPQQPGGPPILIGGNGPRRTLPLAARYADEWNGVYINPHKFAELNERLDNLLLDQGRQPSAVRRSLMVGTIFGRTQRDIDRRLDEIAARRDRHYSAAELRDSGMVVGDGQQIRDQLEAYAAAGVQRIMLQWLELDDLDGLEALAKALLP